MWWATHEEKEGLGQEGGAMMEARHQGAKLAQKVILGRSPKVLRCAREGVGSALCCCCCCGGGGLDRVPWDVGPSAPIGGGVWIYIYISASRGSWLT